MYKPTTSPFYADGSSENHYTTKSTADGYAAKNMIFSHYSAISHPAYKGRDVPIKNQPLADDTYKSLVGKLDFIDYGNKSSLKSKPVYFSKSLYL